MAKNKALASAQKAYQKGKNARAAQVKAQKPKKKKEKKIQEETRAVKSAKPKTPSTDVSSQYKEYKKSSFAPKTTVTKPKVSNSAQKAFTAGQKAREAQKKRGVTNTSVPKTSGKISDSFKTSKKDLQKAYKKGSQTTTLGTKQKKTTTKVGKSKLESVNALTRSEMSRVETASRYGKQKGNQLLKGGKRTGQKDIREKVGSKTAESAYKSKAATGVMQGMSKADIFSNSVGTYNKQAKKAIKKTKESAAYNVGYGLGMAADMGMGGVASRGASAAELTGKGAAKLLGKEAAKQLPKKAAKEAAEEVAKVSGKQGAKRFAKNRAGELVAETPTNVLDAAKMSLDEDGNLNKKEFKKWLAVNTGLTAGVGGAMEGIGAAATKKLASNTIELIGKRNAGKITEKEAKQLKSNLRRLSAKREANSVSGDIAKARFETINAKDAAKKAGEYQPVTKKFAGRGNRYTQSAEVQGKRARAQYAAKQAENEQRMLDRRIAREQPKLNEKGVAMRRAENYEAKTKQAKALAEEAKKYPDRATIRKQIDDATELLDNLKAKEVNPNVPAKDRAEKIRLVESRIEELRRQEGVVWRAEKAAETSIPKPIAQANKAVETAKKAFKENPTPENKARVELAQEARTKAKKSYTETPKARNEANLTPEQKKLQSERDEAEKAYNEAKQAYEQWDKKGGEFYNKKQRAYDTGNKELGDQYYTEYKSIQEEIARREAEMKRLEAEFNDKNNAFVESQRTGGYAALDEEMPMIKGTASEKQIQNVIKQSEGDLDGVYSAPKNMDEDGVIRSETRGKQGVARTWQQVREALVDNFASLEDIAKQLPDEARNKMLAQINELRRSQKTGRALVAEKGRAIYSKFGLTKRGLETELKREDFEWYCFLKHELDRKKAGNNFTDLSRDEIYKQLKELENKYPKADKDGVVTGSQIADFQKETTKYFDDLLEREVDAGITSAEEAANFRRMYPNYVPTYKPQEFEQMLKRNTKDEIDVGRGLKAATGGSHELVPLYNQMQVKTNVVLKRTELNRTLNLLCQASGTTLDELDEAIPFFKHMANEDKPKALLDTQVFTQSREGKHIAVMYHNGEKMEISIDPEVYDAIRRWSGEDRKWLTLSRIVDNKLTRGVNTQFKKWITDYNIFFGLKNFKRDTATALYYTKDIKGFIKNFPKAFAVCTLPDKLLTKDMKMYKEALQVYKENGGIISQFIARDTATTTFFDTAGKFNPLKWAENFNSTLETIPRMTEFLSAVESNVAKQSEKKIADMSAEELSEAFSAALKDKNVIADSMYRAKDVTLNFDRSGWLGSMLNRGVVPFFNPAIQGLDKLGRKLITDNIKRGAKMEIAAGDTIKSFLKMGAALTGMVAMPTLMWDSMFGDYINGKVEGYEKQSDYNRYANYLLPVGDGKFIKIPKARELASIQASLDYAFDNMKYGSGSKWERLFGEQKERDLLSMANIAYEQIGPVSPFKDNILSPVWRVYNNETWYGGKIESGRDLDLREQGRISEIWDEDTSGVAKYIGKKFNLSPKKVDNVMDSYLGVLYDMGIKQTSSRNSLKGESFGSGVRQILSSQVSTNFMIDSVFQNANATDYYNEVDRRNEKLKKLKEGTPEYTKVFAEQNKDKNAFAYTASQYDELMAQIYLDKNLTRAQKNKYARLIKAQQNAMWGDRKSGKGVSSVDPMADAWNLKDKNGKRVLSTETIINSCSYTSKSGNNTIKDAYDLYKKNGGKSAGKFMEVTLAARDVNRSAGDSLSSPRYEVIAYANELNGIKNSDKVIKSYIEKDTTRQRLTENAKIYKEYGFTIKNYRTQRKTIVQGAFDLGYEYAGDIRDGEKSMLLANARTKKGAKYRDGSYQANDFYIMNRMNGARCLDAKKNGNYKAKDIKDLCDKYKLKQSDDYKWDTDKVVNAINKEHPNASQEVKAAMFNVITGYTYKNPFGSIGDYSLDTDTGVYCSGGYGGWGRRRRGRRRGHWGGYGGGGRGSTFKPVVNDAGSKAKVSNTSRTNSSSKSNLDDAYRRKLKKLREETRQVK